MERNVFFPLGLVPYPWGMSTTVWKQIEVNCLVWGDFLEKLTLFQKAFTSPTPPPTPRP